MSLSEIPPGADMDKERFTEKKYWEERWDRVKLPAITRPTTKHPVVKEILRVFETYLPKGSCTALEIGGAPGRWIAFFNQYYGYDVSMLDYTEIGCQKTRENFTLLGADIEVYQRDFFDDLSDLPRFDIVISMGFAEHFEHMDDVFERHIKLLKQGGILVIGVPNFAGVAAKVLSHTAPAMLARHNLEAMNLENWRSIEEQHGLRPLFKGYIGGFQPKYLKRCENRTFKNLSIRYFFKMVCPLWALFPVLNRYNSPKWSAYLIGIYKLP